MQEKNSCDKGFPDRFNNWIDMVEQCGGTLSDYNDVENELIAISLTFQTVWANCTRKQTAKD